MGLELEFEADGPAVVGELEEEADQDLNEEVAAVQAKHYGHIRPAAVDRDDGGVDVVVVVVLARYPVLDDHGDSIAGDQEGVEGQTDDERVEVSLEESATEVVLDVAREGGSVVGVGFFNLVFFPVKLFVVVGARAVGVRGGSVTCACASGNVDGREGWFLG